MIEETTLSAYRENPQFGGETPSEHDSRDSGRTITRTPAHRWGMVIDLARCTGCSACVVACQAENNVPVVGRDEVRRSREMHWIRIDRYYAECRGRGGRGTSTDALPPLRERSLRNVCPVLATVHSEEGLSQQVYNRCVGTRYCANNCPYKVRRFNWFRLRPRRPAREPGAQSGRYGPLARRDGEMHLLRAADPGGRSWRRNGSDANVADGEIQPACQQSCPARAIVFGDLNDPQEPRVASWPASPR